MCGWRWCSRGRSERATPPPRGFGPHVGAAKHEERHEVVDVPVAVPILTVTLILLLMDSTLPLPMPSSTAASPADPARNVHEVGAVGAHLALPIQPHAHSPALWAPLAHPHEPAGARGVRLNRPHRALHARIPEAAPPAWHALCESSSPA